MLSLHSQLTHGRTFAPVLAVLPMIEVATEALSCPSEDDDEVVMCCDSEGWPLMPLPREFALEHRIWRLEGEGRIVVRS